jgi:NitT/TauT family transport system ATP-binding protein
MSSFFKTMQKEKNSTIMNGAISDKYVNTEAPKSYYGTIPTVETTTDGMYECEEIDVLNFENVCLSFPTDKGEFKLFDNFNLNIKDFKHHGQFISFMGASGSGKSQILKLIAGLNKPNSGKVKLYGKERKDNDSIPMVFQQYSSYPWMTVLENVSLPLRLHGIKDTDKLKGETDEVAINRIAMNMIKIVGLEGHENKYAQYPTLSGGQLQRVSLARNLVYSSKILLLDEATGALDIFAKREMQDALIKVYNESEFDPTILNVTHDIQEACYLSNRIYILEPNPCRIYKIIDVHYNTDKRTQAIKETPEFAEYVRQVEEAMEEIERKNK